MFCNVLDLESCVFLVSPYKHNANTVLNFIIETGFRNPGIRNPEITRVYNVRVAVNNIITGIRNPEITRVYNDGAEQSCDEDGIRNPEIIRVYNFFPSLFLSTARYTQPRNNQGL